MRAATGRTLLAADLHLDPARPSLSDLAARWFADEARGADALWLLGDLFEAWIGDDAFDAIADPALARAVDALHRVAASGTAVHLMHGNRDFLLGEDFARRVGATLHADDEVRVELGGERCLLLHGDTLCTEDVEYQRARPLLRSAAWQAELRAKSVPERLAVAADLRARSRRAHDAGRDAGREPGRGAGRDAGTGIVDVTLAEVDARFAATGATLMVHGHVHRPGEHASSGAAPAPSTRRLVLGDWRSDGATIAVIDGAGARLERFGA